MSTPEQPPTWTAPPPGHPPPGYGPGYGPAYPAPGYGRPGYGPPGYGPPGYGPPPPGWPRPTNTMAVLALVMAFVAAPAGLVLGIIARRQIERTGEEGAGLALAGIIIGAIATGLFVLGFVLWIAFFVAATSGSFGP